MKVGNVLAVFAKELKDSLRDRRTLLSTIIVPTLVMPLLTFGVLGLGSKMVQRARGAKPTVTIVGGDDSPAVVAAVRESPRFRVVPPGGDYQQEIIDKRLGAAAFIPPGFALALEAGTPSRVEIRYYQGELKSGFAADELEDFFRDYRDRRVAAALAAHGLPATFVKPFDVQRQNVAPAEKVAGNLFGGVVPYFIIILCFTGAMYPAIDLTAGEKERGTMETLLCSPAARIEIVLGKFLVVLTGSLSAMAMSLLSMVVSAMATGALFVGPARGLAAQPRFGLSRMPLIDPAGMVGVLAMIVPVAVLFSAVEFTVALFARSSKEAQSYLGPMMLVVLLPAIIGMLPGIDLNARLAFVPLLNLSLVCKEMLSGVWHWRYIGIIFLSTWIYAAVALSFAVRMFNREDVIFRA